jgi:hypothetical protein
MMPFGLSMSDTTICSITLESSITILELSSDNYSICIVQAVACNYKKTSFRTSATTEERTEKIQEIFSLFFVFRAD